MELHKNCGTCFRQMVEVLWDWVCLLVCLLVEACVSCSNECLVSVRVDQTEEFWFRRISLNQKLQMMQETIMVSVSGRSEHLSSTSQSGGCAYAQLRNGARDQDRAMRERQHSMGV